MICPELEGRKGEGYGVDAANPRSGRHGTAIFLLACEAFELF